MPDKKSPLSQYKYKTNLVFTIIIYYFKYKTSLEKQRVHVYVLTNPFYLCRFYSYIFFTILFKNHEIFFMRSNQRASLMHICKYIHINKT